MEIVSFIKDPADRWNETLGYYACQTAGMGTFGAMIISQKNKLLSIPSLECGGDAGIFEQPLVCCNSLLDEIATVAGLHSTPDGMQRGSFLLDLRGTLLQFDVTRCEKFPNNPNYLPVVFLTCGKYLAKETQGLAREMLGEVFGRGYGQYEYTCRATNRRYLVSPDGTRTDVQEQRRSEAREKPLRLLASFLYLLVLSMLTSVGLVFVINLIGKAVEAIFGKGMPSQ